MRLLNTSSFVLKDFIGENIPSYAILSHTWEEEEIVFQDLQSGDDSWRRKKSFKKVSGFCSLSKQDGYEWCWIDTCCIDKSSSAELSEAINSMFRWYAESHICIVYLADVQLDHHEPDKLESFESSRWHRRGWTLQELLAPQSVVFYDLDWNLAGTRFSFRHRISEISGIRAEILEKKFDIEESRNRYCVAEKMSWAAIRETSRVEDMAYCLLGIFDVNMPLLYGESHRAFERLQLHILAATEDLTLLAWKGVWHSRDCEKWYHDPYDNSQLLAPSPAYFARTTKWYTYQGLVKYSYNKVWEVFSSADGKQLNLNGKELLVHMQPTKRVDTLVLNGVTFGKTTDSDEEVLVLCEIYSRRPANVMQFLCLPIQGCEKFGNFMYRKTSIPKIYKFNPRHPPIRTLYQRLAICLEPDPQFRYLPPGRDGDEARERRGTEGTQAILLNMQCPVQQIFKVDDNHISAMLPSYRTVLCYRTEEIILICGWHRYRSGSKHTLSPWIACTSWDGLFATRKAILAQTDTSWNLGDFQRCRLKNGLYVSCKVKQAVALWSPAYQDVVSERVFQEMAREQLVFSLDVSVASAGEQIEPVRFTSATSCIGHHELEKWLDDEVSTRRNLLLAQNKGGQESDSDSC